MAKVINYIKIEKNKEILHFNRLLTYAMMKEELIFSWMFKTYLNIVNVLIFSSEKNHVRIDIYIYIYIYIY